MSSIPPKIENLGELIESNLNGSKILSYKTRYLTKPGDNYGSVMLGITANIKKPNGIIENLELVGKIPPTNEIYWRLFEPERSCPAENSIYLSVAPTLEKFQIENNVPESKRLDVFTKCYGARLSLDMSDNVTVDKNALLVLENLISNGYKLAAREDGFDYKHTIVTLKNLAQFHALPIAFRNAHPNEFKTKIIKYLKRFDMNNNIEHKEFDIFINNSIKDLKTMPEIYSENLLLQIEGLIKLNMEYMGNPNECPDGPFNTISHYDFWVNNMMFLYDENKDPVKLKILDYQISQYESLAHDLIFVLFSSVKTSILQEKYHELLEYYYNEFIATLELVGCPTNNYSLDIFYDEIKRIAPVQFTHILFMLRVVFAKADGMPDDFADMNFDVISNENCFDHTYMNKLRDFIKLYKKFGYM